MVTLIISIVSGVIVGFIMKMFAPPTEMHELFEDGAFWESSGGCSTMFLCKMRLSIIGIIYRHYFNVFSSQRDLLDIYLKTF